MFSWAVGKIKSFPIKRKKRNDGTPETSCSVGGESSSSSDIFISTPKRKHDVFLSFAGKDTRLKFTDHLYDALIRDGIKAFRDNEGIERGEVISQQLHQAIKDSLCAVVILSENYADSTWCLDELQMILECRSKLGQQVFPIFYDIDPSDVRHQRKNFGEALAAHEERFRENKGKVQRWRNSLHEISNLSGWDSRGWHEADLIKDIVGNILNYSYPKLPSYDKNLVGIELRVEDLMSSLEIESDEVHFVGIWGMGGVGKTTLARVVSEKISNQFDKFYFLPNIRETSQREGLVSLQKKLVPQRKHKITDVYEGNKSLQNLFCNKKILLILDDVDHMNQVQNLAQSQWFGKGSRVIITTRNSQLLIASKVQRIYKMETLKEDDSLQLFSNKAFDNNHPEKDYLELSQSVVKYSGGLPLALIVLGSFLYGRSEDEWTDTIDRLKQILDNDIYQILRISYDGLNEEEKTIFLDIACFFRGSQKTSVTRILKHGDLHTTIGIKVLIQKALLVETEDYRLEMHDLLEELGKYIVRQESPNDVGKRSRLWEFEDIKEVLENNKGSDAIQAIVLRSYHHKAFNKIEVHHEAFLKMSNIRLLLNRMSGDSLILPGGMKLSASLKVVGWNSFPLDALPLPLDKVVDIRMSESKIKHLWNGIQFMQKLKYIGLSYCKDFIETPDFSGVPYLEHLHLSYCNSLVKVHPSLGELERLIVVQLINCASLEILPRKLQTNSLMKLDVSWCAKVAVLPEFGKGVKKLSYLDVRFTSITMLPESLGSLTGLKDLDLSHCKILNLDQLLKPHIPLQIYGLNVTSLTVLNLSWCGLKDESIVDDFGCLSSLIKLDLSYNYFVNLSTSCFSHLFGLLFLSLEHCGKLKSLPRLPPRLIRLNASHCDSMEPLSSDGELWNLAASLDHQYRGQTKYAISNEENDYSPLEFKYIEPEECHPLRDFLAFISGDKIPSWFPDKEYYPTCENIKECVIKVDIPPCLRYSEWSGIVVCLRIIGFGSVEIGWSSKASEDDDYICNKWAHSVYFGKDRKLFIMVLELNEKTCWQHLAPPNNSLHIKFFTKAFSYGMAKIWGSGWRVICKEEMKEWCNHNDHNQLTLPQLSSPHEVKLPRRVVDRFIRKKPNFSSIPFYQEDVLDAW